MGGRIGMGNTCKSMADSCHCMTKPLQYCKVISLQLIKINEKKKSKPTVPDLSARQGNNPETNGCLWHHLFSSLLTRPPPSGGELRPTEHLPWAPHRARHITYKVKLFSRGYYFQVAFRTETHLVIMFSTVAEVRW